MTKIGDIIVSTVHNKKRIIPIIIAIGIMGFILSPLPGTDAVSIAIIAFNTALNNTNQHDLDITVLADITQNIPFSGTQTGPETIAANSKVRLTIDKGTTNEQICTFLLDGTPRATENVNCDAVSQLLLKRVTDNVSDPYDYNYFGYGYFYHYGYTYKYAYGTTYHYTLIGNGTYVYGLTANRSYADGVQFTNDVHALYKIFINPFGLSTGTHNIIADVVDPNDSTMFIRSNNVGEWTNTQPSTSTQTASGPIGAVGFTATNGALSPITVVPQATIAGLTGGAFPPGITFPFGFYSFTITTGIGASSTVTITTPAAIPAGSGYFKVIGGALVPLPVGLVGDNDGDTTLTITLTDGGSGDTDGVANGVITDPGGIGVGAGGGGGGGVAGGGGGGGGGGGAAAIRGGTLHFYDISWDICDSSKRGTVNIVGGTDGSEQSLSAKIRTSGAGITKASLAAEQPYEKENKSFKTKRLLFTAPISSNEQFFTAYIEDARSSISHTVQLNKCSGKTSYDEFTETLSTATPTIPGGNTFTFTYAGQEFEINYKMEGTITDASVDEDSKSVSFTLSDVKAGDLLITLPRGLIDATNDQFVTLVTASPQEEVANEVIESTDTYAMLQLPLPEDAKDLTVVGTSVVPEFGIIAAMILGIAIISLVAITRTQRFNLLK